MTTWVRYEWILKEGVLTNENVHAIVGEEQGEASMNDIIEGWSGSHQWYRGPDVVIGVPPERDADRMYLVIFVRKGAST